MSMEQLSFGWDGESQINATAELITKTFDRLTLRQTVLAFLLSLSPNALALQVPLRKRRYLLDAAVIYGNKKFNTAATTVAVDVFTSRDECLPACLKSEELFKQLNELENQRLEMESNIRQHEPHLKAPNDLFEDEHNACYEYKKSTLYPYNQLLKKVAKTRHAAYKGSRMQIIRQCAAVDYLYLAVPEGLIQKHELAPGWGLIYLDEHSFSIIEPAPCLSDWVKPELRNHLALNIAQAAKDAVLFANGVLLKPKQISPTFTAAPRRRRKVKE